MRTLPRLLVVPALAVLAAAVFVGGSAAKGNEPLLLCGPSRCASLGPAETRTRPSPFLKAYAHGDTAAATPAPYYAIRFAPDEPALGYWIPSARVLRFTSSSFTAAWVRPSSWELRRLGPAVQSVRPYPSVRIRVVSVAGTIARQPQSYLALYRAGEPDRIHGLAWEQIYLVGDESPWTDGQNDLWVAARGPYLRRDGRTLRIPPSLARRIRLAQPLDGSTSHSK